MALSTASTAAAASAPLPAPPPGGYTPALAAELLSLEQPLAATAALARALGVPTAPERGGRFALGAPLRGALLVELLFGALQLAREHGFGAAQAAAALRALHGLLGAACARASGAGGAWPPHGEACAQWAQALREITAPGAGSGSGAEAAAAAAGAASAAAGQPGGSGAGAGAGGAEGLLTPQLAGVLSAWVLDNGALLPHHWAMYGEALAGGSAAGQRALVRVAVVEEPPPPETLPPLAVARQLDGETLEGEVAAAAAAAEVAAAAAAAARH